MTCSYYFFPFYIRHTSIRHLLINGGRGQKCLPPPPPQIYIYEQCCLSSVAYPSQLFSNLIYYDLYFILDISLIFAGINCVAYRPVF